MSYDNRAQRRADEWQRKARSRIFGNGQEQRKRNERKASTHALLASPHTPPADDAPGQQAERKWQLPPDDLTLEAEEGETTGYR